VKQGIQDTPYTEALFFAVPYSLLLYAVKRFHAGPDTSAQDCAKMLGDIPDVPQSVEEFERFIKTGRIPLPPNFYKWFIVDNPSLEQFVFAAGSNDSRLAKDVESLIASYCNAGGTGFPNFS
jgi:hypothetical protein